MSTQKHQVERSSSFCMKETLLQVDESVFDMLRQLKQMLHQIIIEKHVNSCFKSIKSLASNQSGQNASPNNGKFQNLLKVPSQGEVMSRGKMFYYHNRWKDPRDRCLKRLSA